MDLDFLHLQVMAVAGMTSDGIPCTDNPPKKMWLTPPSSPHRIRSSLHNPTPHHSSSALASEETRSGCNLSVTKEPLAQRYSTGDIGTSRDPSSAFYESLTGKESETMVAPKKESSDSIAGSAESLVAKVSLCIVNHIGASKKNHFVMDVAPYGIGCTVLFVQLFH